MKRNGGLPSNLSLGFGFATRLVRRSLVCSRSPLQSSNAGIIWPFSPSSRSCSYLGDGPPNFDSSSSEAFFSPSLPFAKSSAGSALRQCWTNASLSRTASVASRPNVTRRALVWSAPRPATISDEDASCSSPLPVSANLMSLSRKAAFSRLSFLSVAESSSASEKYPAGKPVSLRVAVMISWMNLRLRRIWLGENRVEEK